MFGPCAPCPPAFQPLPISTSGNGIDRCGNVHQYAAPNVIDAAVCWPTPWPIPQQFMPNPGFWNWGSWSGISSLLTQGAAAANWMIAASHAPSVLAQQNQAAAARCQPGWGKARKAA